MASTAALRDFTAGQDSEILQRFALTSSQLRGGSWLERRFEIYFVETEAERRGVVESSEIFSSF